MKIAIHHRVGSFSDRWIEYCQKNNIDYKLVNAFDNDIIQQVKDCDAFMWHHHHGQFKDVLTAKRILFSLEQAGIKVFPNFNTGWHFDDKVAQKYLLEAIDAPLVPSYVFYDKEEALAWAKETTYPKVFKLKGGAGATNVQLVKNKKQAYKLIDQSFNKGFKQYDRLLNLYDSFKKLKNGNSTIRDSLKSIIRLIKAPEFSSKMPPEKGYIYFQDFIPNNKTDFRLKIVAGRAWGFQRGVRTDDFRASGSGSIIFDNSQIPRDMLETAFNVYNKMKAQSIAFDFIISEDNKPLIIEISYGFGIDEGEFTNGYWDAGLQWQNKLFDPREWMIEYLIARKSDSIRNKFTTK